MAEKAFFIAFSRNEKILHMCDLHGNPMGFIAALYLPEDRDIRELLTDSLTNPKNYIMLQDDIMRKFLAKSAAGIANRDADGKRESYKIDLSRLTGEMFEQALKELEHPPTAHWQSRIISGLEVWVLDVSPSLALVSYEPVPGQVVHFPGSGVKVEHPDIISSVRKHKATAAMQLNKGNPK